MTTFSAKARCARWGHRLRYQKEGGVEWMACRCGKQSRPMTVKERVKARTLESAFENALRPSTLLQHMDKTQRWTG